MRHSDNFINEDFLFMKQLEVVSPPAFIWNPNLTLTVLGWIKIWFSQKS